MFSKNRIPRSAIDAVMQWELAGTLSVPHRRVRPLRREEGIPMITSAAGSTVSIASHPFALTQIVARSRIQAIRNRRARAILVERIKERSHRAFGHLPRRRLKIVTQAELASSPRLAPGRS